LGLMLVQQSKEISPFAPILLGIYPFTETLFSIYRRSIIGRSAFNEPDNLHLHSLIFRRVIKQNSRLKTLSLNGKNACVNLYFVFPTAILGLLSCVFYKNTLILVFLMFCYFYCYFSLFNRIISWQIQLRSVNLGND